ncbi:MAG: hypothetical protein DRI75_12055 [Bacteroidetes bacterium]|nr:MAG: hypothetical protein DRI75_12055 [Bacteroidota bacterium]
MRIKKENVDMFLKENTYNDSQISSELIFKIDSGIGIGSMLYLEAKTFISFEFVHILHYEATEHDDVTIKLILTNITTEKC